MVQKGISRLTGVFLVPFLVTGLSISSPAWGQSTKTSKAPAKKTGYMGDPARKRGLELGFDMGLKAGKEDLAKNQKPNPAEQEPYKNPDKYYRYEFGSRANFVAGFKSGFVGGYQQAFGKKVPLKADGTTTAAPTPPKPKAAPPPPANPAADAL